MEFRHVKTGSLNIPPPSMINGGPPPPPSAVAGIPTAMGRFDSSRSPPGRQNTSHVPCKFFRAGACQAGNSCPFSHDPASTTDNICKYFAKGNCKFGPKCANIHVLPDGRRVNYTKTIGTGQLNIGGRVNNDYYHPLKSGSALSNTFVRAKGVPPPPPFGQQLASFRDDASLSARRQASVDISIAGTDASFAQAPGPGGDEEMNRYGLALSPVTNKTIGILDVPLNSTYDSKNVPWIPHNKLMATSAPLKFGPDHPLPDLLGNRDGRSSETLKNLHHSVFGEENRDRFVLHAASPSTQIHDDYVSKRAMNSLRTLKMVPKSISVPKTVDKDWEANFTFEEDYLPETLKDLMTPQEKARRGSRNADEEGRFTHSGAGTPNNDASSKFGSPSNASPSRWGPLFQRQKEEEDHMRISAFGHVGSPLRNSTLNPSSSPKSKSMVRPNSNNDTTSLYLNSPPRQSSTSALSQQLQRTRLSRAESNCGDAPLYHARPVSGLMVTKSSLMAERRISSSSLGTGCTGRFANPMDGENTDCFFNMEGDEMADRTLKRNSGGWATYGRATESPRLSTIGGTSKIDPGESMTSTGGLQSMFSRGD